MSGPKQLGLFGDVSPVGAASIVSAVPPDAALVRLTDALSPHIRLGTSSWSFPGWSGIVYQGVHTSARLARDGLPAYSSHPLMRTVGLDRTYYGPIDADALAKMAEQVPVDFRFLVKAHEYLTLRQFPQHRRYGARAGKSSPFYLDAEYASREVFDPTMAGLGTKLGVVLLQFAPQNLGRAYPFSERLSRFLSRLPRGAPVAVELRTRSAFSDEYIRCLEGAGASHTLLVHPSMPSVGQQFERTRHLSGTVVIRWMLRPDRQYGEARDEFAPFDRVVAPDEQTLSELADIVSECAQQRRPTIVIANNKAEGCSPLSLERLARVVADRL